MYQLASSNNLWPRHFPSVGSGLVSAYSGVGPGIVPVLVTAYSRCWSWLSPDVGSGIVSMLVHA